MVTTNGHNNLVATPNKLHQFNNGEQSGIARKNCFLLALKAKNIATNGVPRFYDSRASNPLPCLLAQQQGEGEEEGGAHHEEHQGGFPLKK